jgi:hypothetical protein
MKNVDASRSELRSFGATVGGIFLAIGLWPLLWSLPPRGWALAVGTVLLAAGGLAPQALAPVFKAWSAVGHLMGRINTKVILALFFYGILAPIGLLARLFGKDFIGIRSGSQRDTYRVPRTARPVTHVRHQF